MDKDYIKKAQQDYERTAKELLLIRNKHDINAKHFNNFLTNYNEQLKVCEKETNQLIAQLEQVSNNLQKTLKKSKCVNIK